VIAVLSPQQSIANAVFYISGRTRTFLERFRSSIVAWLQQRNADHIRTARSLHLVSTLESVAWRGVVGPKPAGIKSRLWLWKARQGRLSGISKCINTAYEVIPMTVLWFFRHISGKKRGRKKLRQQGNTQREHPRKFGRRSLAGAFFVANLFDPSEQKRSPISALNHVILLLIYAVPIVKNSEFFYM